MRARQFVTRCDFASESHKATHFQSNKRILRFSAGNRLNHPPYRPDLSHCDYHVFGQLKLALKRQNFTCTQAVHDAWKSGSILELPFYSWKVWNNLYHVRTFA
ncbi:hypothetical protein AVEN_186408-1 [Araneus ventricosus]|uniref:Uncharacterized protein n=1 Tax=Araneus ventricosus TaxID=182803 RepID=A0A4Y2CYY9_ARAVE|nr:hypothetical protein AVEN_186408-1 [Araneus ventricosus]